MQIKSLFSVRSTRLVFLEPPNVSRQGVGPLLKDGDVLGGLAFQVAPLVLPSFCPREEVETRERNQKAALGITFAISA